MLRFLTVALRFFAWVLLPTILAHPANNEAKISTLQVDLAPIPPSSTLTSEYTTTSLQSTWTRELKRQDLKAITTCIPFQAYDSCSSSCSSDARATTCISRLFPLCHETYYVYASGSTSTSYGCDLVGTPDTIYLTSIASITTSRSTSTRDASTLILISTLPPTSSILPTSFPTLGSPTSTPSPTGGTVGGSRIPTDFGVGGIVGATIGGAVIIALLAFWARSRKVRRRRQKVAAAASRATESSSDAVSAEKRFDHATKPADRLRTDPLIQASPLRP